MPWHPRWESRSLGPFRRFHKCHTNNIRHIRNRSSELCGHRRHCHRPPETPGKVEDPPSISFFASASLMLERRQGNPQGVSAAPSFSGLGRRPFTAVARVRIPLGSLLPVQLKSYGPVAQLVSVPPCHGGGRGFKSRQGRSER